MIQKYYYICILFTKIHIYITEMKIFMLFISCMLLLFSGISQSKNVELGEMAYVSPQSKDIGRVATYELTESTNEIENVDIGGIDGVQTSIPRQYNHIVYFGSTEAPIYCHSYREENGDYILIIEIRQGDRIVSTQVKVPISSVREILKL